MGTVRSPIFLYYSYAPKKYAQPGTTHRKVAQNPRYNPEIPSFLIIFLISGIYFNLLSLFIYALILSKSAGTHKNMELNPPRAPLISDFCVGFISGYLLFSSLLLEKLTRYILHLVSQFFFTYMVLMGTTAIRGCATPL